MLTLQIASDLHHEWVQSRFKGAPLLELSPQADVLVLAGDIHSHTLGLGPMLALGKPVVYVAGNHEFYGKQFQATLDSLRAEARAPVQFLEQRIWRCGEVRFLGVTLWTDYALYGQPDAAKALANRALNDHCIIRLGERVFTAEDARQRHHESVAWLKRNLAQPHTGKTVVVTHHGPHPAGVAPQFQGDPLTPAFFSDLRPLMSEVDLWIFGHTHASVDLQEGRCRVVANPRGYPRNRNYAQRWDELVFENPTWKPQLLVRI